MRQTGKRSDFRLFSFRGTGSDLMEGWPIAGGSRSRCWTDRMLAARGPGRLLHSSTVQSQQHGYGFLQELAELSEPLRADRPVHHPVVAAQRHRHHAGYVEPAETHVRHQLTSDIERARLLVEFNSLTLSRYRQVSAVSLSLRRQGCRTGGG